MSFHFSEGQSASQKVFTVCLLLVRLDGVAVMGNTQELPNLVGGT